MQEHFYFEGKWFLPGQFENNVAGNLEYTPAKGITLKLLGLLVEKRQESHEPDLINGITSDGKFITLYKCYSTGFSLIQTVLKLPNMKYYIFYLDIILTI